MTETMQHHRTCDLAQSMTRGDESATAYFRRAWRMIAGSCVSRAEHGAGETRGDTE